MGDDTRLSRNVISPRMRTFWKILTIMLSVLLAVCFLTGFSMYWWPGIPPSPRPAEGRVYPLNNHGTYTYMNRQEYLLNQSVRWMFLVLLLPCAAIIHFVDPFDEKRRWRPVIPPRRW
jgi:hypothetical protein